MRSKSRNTPSPITNFDDSFIEFVRKMRENAQFSTPEKISGVQLKDISASNSSINKNRDLSSSYASTSSIILSGAIMTSSLVSNNAASSVSMKTPSTLDKNASISVETTHIPSKNASVPMVTKSRWTGHSKKNENIKFKTNNESTQPMIITKEDANKQISVGTKLLTTTISPAQSTLTSGNVEIKTKTELVSFNNAFETSLPVFVLTKAVEVTSTQSSPYTLTPENLQLQALPSEVKTRPALFTTASVETTPLRTVTKVRRRTTPSTSPMFLTETIQDQPKDRPVSTKRIKSSRISNKTKTARNKTSAVPAKNTRPQFKAGSLLAKALTAVPLPALQTSSVPIQNASIPDTNMFARPSPMSLLCEAAALAELKEKAEELEGKLKPSSATAVMKTENLVKNDKNDVAMQVEYLGEEYPRPVRKRRPKGTGGKRVTYSSIPSYNDYKKMRANPQPEEKKRPGRPRKPFTFDRIVTGMKSIKLPNFFWSASIHEIASIGKQVTFSRGRAVNSFNPHNNDRVVKFTNSMEYSVQINNRDVKLIAAPSTINTFKDIQILLKIVNDIALHDPMLEYF